MTDELGSTARPSGTANPASFQGSVRIRRDQLAWRRAGDEAVVLDLVAASYHALNPTGAFLWEHLDDWMTGTALAAVLANAFDLASDVAAGDVDRFLAGCIDADLLEVHVDDVPERT